MKNGNIGEKNYCPFCHLVVAPGNRETIFTQNGKAHFTCAIAYYVKILDSPRPLGVTESWHFKNYLIEQGEELLRQKPTKKTEQTFKKILQIHEELYGEPLKISSLVASA